ncbi:hypothetical protein FA10DRAFT_175907 [Acaromyces ingoldii]|uniref:Uncharacterized protein n=1 Tax=Acaromyces ingoldii TaxID=215250 RepID=A0A316YDT5_9BASI|nr:hypothetical protein FA10DRAFT_175907 [Acaromyces ingoldii]PWN87760.1 hypothetical protein FA10DRAFT_175907 [Acaromyces ingoldii]
MRFSLLFSLCCLAFVLSIRASPMNPSPSANPTKSSRRQGERISHYKGFLKKDQEEEKTTEINLESAMKELKLNPDNEEAKTIVESSKGHMGRLQGRKEKTKEKLDDQKRKIC